MSKTTNQKLKLLYLMKIFLEKTDEHHSVTMTELITALKAYDINAERKSIYSDIELLRLYGMNIIGEKKDKSYCYYVASREFELAELRVLVDLVQAAKFITEKKSKELIKKIESIASKYEAKELERQVFVMERIKSMNESIYYSVDKLNAALNYNVKVKFQYFQWNVNKNMELRHNGEFYCISPWALSWDDENYYLIGFDSKADMIKHYRVDKMLKIELTEEKREGKEHFEQFDTGVYAKKRFGMFDGEEQNVKLEFENRYAGVVIDRFGKSTKIIKTDAEHFTIIVQVAMSNQFLAWVIALGTGVRVIAPESAVERMKKELDSVRALYNEDR